MQRLLKMMCLCLSVFAVLCGTDIACADDELVVACDRNFAPYTFVDPQGHARGMLVDLWSLWGERTGVQVQFAFFDWDGSIRAVREGRADVHSGLFPNLQRAQWFDFSRAIYHSSTGVFVPAGSQVRGLDDLGEDAVGAIAGSDAAHTLEAAGVSLHEYPSPKALIGAARRGEIAAFADERLGMLAFLRANDLRDAFLLSEQPLYFKDMVAAVRKGRSGLLSHVNQGLGLITAEEVSALEQYWMGL